MTNVITRDWAREVLEANMEGFTKEERYTYLNDVQNHGCISGCVSGVIYKPEINAIFKEHMEDILSEIDYYQNDLGYRGLTEVEPMDIPQTAVWFMVEIKATEMYNTIEEEEAEAEQEQYNAEPETYNSNWDEE